MTLGEYGRSIGLSEQSIIDTLCIALELAGPGVGGRYVGMNHPLSSDPTCQVAVELLDTLANESGIFPLDG